AAGSGGGIAPGARGAGPCRAGRDPSLPDFVDTRSVTVRIVSWRCRRRRLRLGGAATGGPQGDIAMHAYRKTRLIRRPLAATLPLVVLASAALPAMAGNSCLTTNINDVTDIFSDSVLNGSITQNGGTFACGRDNIADGEGATAMGYNNWAGGVLSSAFGFNNKIAGQAQGAAVFGTNNTS